jgi:hypothetical protein
MKGVRGCMKAAARWWAKWARTKRARRPETGARNLGFLMVKTSF